MLHQECGWMNYPFLSNWRRRRRRRRRRI